MKTNQVGIIGIGRLGECVAKALLRHFSGLETLYVTERNTGRVSALQQNDHRVRPVPTQEILDRCDILFLTLPTSAARTELPILKFEPRHYVVSALAEIPLNELRDLVGSVENMLSRALLLPSIENGGQEILVYPSNPGADSTIRTFNTLLVAENEDQFLTIWATTGVISAAMLTGLVTARWLQSKGIPKQISDRYARQLYALSYDLSANGFDEAIRHVSTPGGLNEASLKTMRHHRFDDYLNEILDRIDARLKTSIEE